MRTLKKLPFLLAFVITLFAAGCSDIDVRPSGGGEEDDEPVIVKPTPPGAQSQGQSISADTVSIA